MTGASETIGELPWATRELGLGVRHGESATPADPALDGVDWLVPDLIEPGLRHNNPRRAHLLISTVLGKHLPTDPHRVIAAANSLGDLVLEVLAPAAAAPGPAVGTDTGPAPDAAVAAAARSARTSAAAEPAAAQLDSTPIPAVVLGFAETATGLGHGVAARIGAACYLHSTRRDVPTAQTLTGFEEGHSHATSHLLQPAPAEIFLNSLPMVLVDDEISTGATALDAIRSLHEFTPRTHYVLASLVDMRTEDDRAAFEKAAAELGARIDTVCLASGETLLPDRLVESVAALPAPELNPVAEVPGHVARIELPWPADVPEGGRHGILDSDTPAFDAALAATAATLWRELDALAWASVDPERGGSPRPVIVLGHEEFMYLPLRLAAALADSGVPTRYQTTTRSPAYVLDEPGYPLRRGFRFTAPEPDDVPRFVYNARWPEPAAADPILLVVVDEPGDTDRLYSGGGLIDVLTASGADVVVAVLPAADPRALAAARTASPAAPEFDSPTGE